MSIAARAHTSTLTHGRRSGQTVSERVRRPSRRRRVGRGRASAAALGREGEMAQVAPRGVGGLERRDQPGPTARQGDVVDEMRGTFGHAPPATTRTEPAPFTGERHEPLGRAVRAPEPRETSGPVAAPQERPELVFHEPGEAMAVARPRGVVEEVLDVLPYHCVDGGGTRIARSVLEGGHAPLGADDMPQRERPECWAER